MTNSKHEQLSQERKKLQAEGRIPPWYSTPAWQMFKSRYLVEEEGDVRTRFRKLAQLARYLPEPYATEYEQKFYDLMDTNVLSPSSPVLANTNTNPPRGMNVSCSGQDIPDHVHGFYQKLGETADLTKNAFGTSGSFSSIRPRGAPISSGGTASGAIPVIEDFFNCASKISQGGIRQGSFAAYLHMDHGDFDEACDSLHTDHKGKNYGWIITDVFVNRLMAKEPDTLRRWKKAIHTKLLTGKGYLFFIDKANRHRPDMYKKLGLDIKASNLCTEVLLHSSEEYSFSCILSSLNLFHWDKIKDSDAVFTAMVFLDCLCSDFIAKSEGVVGLEKVREFTLKGRAVGLGTMGFHTYLQSKRIPYESLEAHYLNTEIFKHIHDETLHASQWLAELLGEPEWCKGYGVRNTHRTAQAPTKSTAGLMGGMSESTSADPAMAYTAGSAAGEIARIPPVFLELMKEKGVYNQDTITDIIQHVGSVQHVDWLDDHEKQVFKTAFEIDPWVVFRHAVRRQKYLCQGQSLNFYLPENDQTEDLISDLMSACAMEEEILSQYYIYTRSGIVISDECVACSA